MTPPTAEGGALRSQSFRRARRPARRRSTARSSASTRTPARRCRTTRPPATRTPTAAGSSPTACATRSASRSGPGTSEIWFGDVGWNTWEEVNRIPDTERPSATTAGPATRATPRMRRLRHPQPQPVREPVQRGNARGAVLGLRPRRRRCPAARAARAGTSSVTGVAFYTGTQFPAAVPQRAVHRGLRAPLHHRDARRAPNGVPDPSTVRDLRGRRRRPGRHPAGPRRPRSTTSTSRAARSTGSPYPGRQPPADGARHRDARPRPDAAERRRSTAAPRAIPTAAAHLQLGPQRRRHVRRLDDANADASPTRRRATTRAAARHRPAGGTDTVTLPITAGDAPRADDRQPDGRVHVGGRRRDLLRRLGGRRRRATRSRPPALTLAAEHPPLLAHRPEQLPHALRSTGDGVASGTFIAPNHDYPSHLELVLTATDAQRAEASQDGRRWTRRPSTSRFASIPPGAS